MGLLIVAYVCRHLLSDAGLERNITYYVVIAVFVKILFYCYYFIYILLTILLLLLLLLLLGRGVLAQLFTILSPISHSSVRTERFCFMVEILMANCGIP
jgi:hypothetical protein